MEPASWTRSLGSSGRFACVSRPERSLPARKKRPEAIEILAWTCYIMKFSSGGIEIAGVRLLREASWVSPMAMATGGNLEFRRGSILAR